MTARVEVQNLTVRYRDLVAVDDVSFSIPAGSTLGLVGESGSGKSTVARAVVGMITPDAGTALVDGEPVTGRSRRRAAQMVFQDPNSSLNPKLTVRQMLGEALRVHRIVPRGQVASRSVELLELVRLDGDVLDRYPAEFSGGQRQRLAIARAIAVEPTVLVADEPTSALDVSVQSAVLDLLRALRERLGLTVLFISHDLGVINAVADTVAVMQSGRLVEVSERAAFFANPRDPYSRMLLAAVSRLPESAVVSEPPPLSESSPIESPSP
ncbi:MAG: ATP-binding cassette domain-containing protein [Actinobacteria bacterium]|nr:ATP-binding cassette domain-containing protein [Actinomycetota bacterium]